MLLAIHRHLPAGVRVVPPHGGLFIWLNLPDSLSADDLLPLACEEGVAFAPGRRFFPEPTSDTSGLRLSFVTQTPERIEEGIERLGKAIRRLSVMH